MVRYSNSSFSSLGGKEVVLFVKSRGLADPFFFALRQQATATDSLCFRVFKRSQKDDAELIHHKHNHLHSIVTMTYLLSNNRPKAQPRKFRTGPVEVEGARTGASVSGDFAVGLVLNVRLGGSIGNVLGA